MGRPRRIGPRPKYPHTTIYADGSVLQHLRELAAERGCKTNDLMIEGLALMFERHGRADVANLLFEIGFERGRQMVRNAESTTTTEKEPKAA